ncbi:hypothetical protein PSP6_690121 [Paraburkholderia tropica]|uniref:hypothetical protein n=1 Tax=Paraburkholderia tropica TaxID=92647 RepID=UPI001CB30669|nr:hypothetical protein [Paraburkholderia tropica]CAG9236004.1 hypothetical protein PSP6_690121 [Paraburkholderia tropica]
MSLKKIFESLEAERNARRNHDGGVLLLRSPEHRIAEITKHLGDAWAGGNLRDQMVKVAAAAIEAIEQHDISQAEQAAFYATTGE